MAIGISLHIGVNEVDPTHYGGWSGPLNACEADAEDMRGIADSQGYESTMLLTAQTTRDAVKSAIQSAAGALATGDIFFLSYSGHGGQVPDRNHDESDLADETWCLYDGQLLDDELRHAWAQFPDDARILVLSDSCHSGTVTRAPVSPAACEAITSGVTAEMLGTVRAVYRFMPDDIAVRTYRQNRDFYDTLQGGLSMTPPQLTSTVRLISGCQDNQLSLDGTFNGLFTGQLLRVWSSGHFQGDYGQFHRTILRRMPSTQSPHHFVYGAPNPVFDAQQPFAIG